MVQREPFNQRLRRLLRDRQMEPKELASRSGLSASYIRVLLANTDRYPSLKSTESIADALGISVGELTGGDEEAQRLRELRLAAETFERANQANEDVRRTVYADRRWTWEVEVSPIEVRPTFPAPSVTPPVEYLRQFWLLADKHLTPEQRAALEAEIAESLEGTDLEDE